jgi:ATPase subunit of ABC transporter with duplicated ATPase domains
VWEELSGGEETLTLGPRKMNSRAYVAGFNFLGSDQQKKVADLSGGERNRVHLAKVLRQGANVLLLDEPTNVVSHDRWFLDRICTHIIAFEEDGGVNWFVGNCSDYEADRRKRLGIAAETPHRLIHRRLTRS